MAQPRVFVSSTCYDLQEIRFQLRTFIEDFGFIPVMSEYGDIFYDYKKHIQESCKEEIEKSQFFILIIGNNFGSIYYKHNTSSIMPDSVTMQEFRKSIETNIYKHIFVNKFVDYDYKNYKNLLEKYISKHFESVEVEENKINDIINDLINKFKKEYMYPKESYKYIFNFLDIVYSLRSNNAVIIYENFENIKLSLRKQWSGFMYEAVTKNRSVSINVIERLGDKINRIENQIKLLADGQITDKDNGLKITFDIKNLVTKLNIEEFYRIKSDTYDLVYKILGSSNKPFEYDSRIRFYKKADKNIIKNWLFSLENIILKYKWATNVDVSVVFSNLKIDYELRNKQETMPYDFLINLYSLFSNVKDNFKKNDFDDFLEAISDLFNKFYIEFDNEDTEIPF